MLRGLSLLQNRPEGFWGQTSLLFNGNRGAFLGIKRPGREVDHSSPSRAEVKNEWSYTSTFPIHFHGVDRKNFTFICYHVNDIYRVIKKSLCT
jgi:hypothetical protein